MPRRLTYLILSVAAVAASFLVWSAWRNSRTLSDGEMLARLPDADGVVVSIDLGQIRHSGLFGELTGTKALQDADYLAFVRDTGFDYQRDLDEVLAAFTPAGNFFVVRGRFDWKKLEDYAKKSGGSCYDQLCHMQGSVPEHKISFLPLAAGVMGLAVSGEELAASRLLHPGAQRPIRVPMQPVWLSIPGASLNRTAREIPGAAFFTQTVTGVQNLMLTLGPKGGPKGSAVNPTSFTLMMEAQCDSVQDAGTLTGQLRTYTSIFKAALEHEKKQPDPRDLSGVLTAGQFHQSERAVYGEWTLEKAFLDQLAGSSR